MDYKAINNTLNRYFDGTSTLEEERLLKQYFSSAQVRPEHMTYKPLFDHYGNAQNVTNPNQVRLPYKKQRNYKLAIAAILVLGLGLFGLYRQNLSIEKQIVSKNITPEKKKEAYKEIQKFSNSVNESMQRVGALSIFAKTTKKVFKINQRK